MENGSGIMCGDAGEMLRELSSNSVHCCITSPPYWGLRDYGVEGQLGLEKTPEEYVGRLVEIFREVKRVLRGDGTLWLNLGDSYIGSGKHNGINLDSDTWKNCKQATNKASGGKTIAVPEGFKPKDLCGIPWRVAFALQSDGWWLRSDIIWSKPNPMPESVKDRPTKAHEYIFLLSKSAKYFFDQDAVREEVKQESIDREKYGWNKAFEGRHVGSPVEKRPFSDSHGGFTNNNGRNIRTVWTIATQPQPEAHFATFPEALVERCIKAGCPENGTVLDPFAGTNTTGRVAKKLNRNFIAIELNPKYIEIAERVYEKQVGLLI